MKHSLKIFLSFPLLAFLATAQDEDLASLQELSGPETAARLLASAEKLAEVQDELSADVMELVESQTVAEVIEILEGIEKIMTEVTLDLSEGSTGGPTIAAQTEIIEQILAAAKKKQQSSSESSPESQESMEAMLDMMERMMGKEPGDSKSQGPPQEGEEPNDTGGGGGVTGDSDTANSQGSGGASEEGEVRTVPKASAPSGRGLPGEFRKLLDAYNRNDSSPAPSTR